MVKQLMQPHGRSISANPQAFRQLKGHPNCRVTLCDDAHWQRLMGKRPHKHQIRQTRNATLGYSRAKGLDWVMHLDVDEFLVSDTPISQYLAQLPEGCLTARVRPMEALAKHEARAPDAYKKFLPNGAARLETVMRLYPTYGAYVKGGFVSHVAGKVFARTGQDRTIVKIHNAIVAGQENPGLQELAAVSLAHCHALSWDDWRNRFPYRLDKGSYRADLSPAIALDKGGATLHTLFETLLEEQGEAGLKAFFDEICADTPEHRTRLDREGLLRVHDLDLEAKMSKHFPDFDC